MWSGNQVPRTSPKHSLRHNPNNPLTFDLSSHCLPKTSQKKTETNKQTEHVGMTSPEHPSFYFQCCCHLIIYFDKSMDSIKDGHSYCDAHNRLPITSCLLTSIPSKIFLSDTKNDQNLENRLNHLFSVTQNEWLSRRVFTQVKFNGHSPHSIAGFAFKNNSVYGTSRLASIFRLENFVHLLYCLWKYTSK